MMINHMIPAASIEAAAKALHFFKTGAGWKDADPATVWECREQAEAILAQAEQFRTAPHMLATAWDEGAAAQAACYGMEKDTGPNPYRK